MRNTFFTRFSFAMSLLLVILVGLTNTSCESPTVVDDSSDRVKDGLKGKVESVRLTRYEVEKKFGDIVKAKPMQYSINQQVAYHRDGKKMYEYFFQKPEIFYSILSYEYNGDELMKKTIENGEGSLTGMIRFKRNGQTLIESRYDKDGKEEYDIEYLYQDSLVYEEVKWEYKDGERRKAPEYIKRFEYDSRGNIVQIQELDVFEKYLKKNEDEKFFKTTRITYDDHDRVLSERSEEYCRIFFNVEYKDSTLQITEVTYSLNEHGDIVSEDVNITPPLDNRARTNSISIGQRVNHFTYSYEYKYDNQGNWIERIEFKDGKPNLLEERKIQYYSD